MRLICRTNNLVFGVQTMVRICVLGAGVVGLSTAVQLQDALPTARVTIVADKFHKDTTSDGAGGLFRPNRSKTPGVPLPVLRWPRDPVRRPLAP